MADNKLYFGDNLDILYRYIGDESVDLIYLDPPFKSSQDYNILPGRAGFAEQNGARSAAQIKAFNDTWQQALIRGPRPRLPGLRQQATEAAKCPRSARIAFPGEDKENTR